MEKYTKDVVTNALQVVDAAVAQFKGNRQDHELIISSIKVLVDISNKYLEETKTEENK